MEIYTYGNAALLVTLLDVIAALLDTDDVVVLVRTLFTITAAIVGLQIAFTGRFAATAKLFGILLIFYAGVISRADVQVVDRINVAASDSVDNVPAGLAVPLHVITTIGDWATQRFDTAFALPADTQFRDNGMLFASRLVEDSTRFEPTEPVFAANLTEFSRGCILYGATAGWFPLSELSDTEDMWGYLTADRFGNAITMTWTNDDGSTELRGCRDARNALDDDWNDAIDHQTTVFGMRLFPSLSQADAQARLLATLPTSYALLTNIAADAADIVRQNTMINTLRRAFIVRAGELGAEAILEDYAIAQAELQQRTVHNTQGLLAARNLPLIRAIFEVVIYGLFPIMIVLIMLATEQGKATFLYLKLLAWLQLWPPLFAILHFITISAATDASIAATAIPGAGTALTLLTHNGLTEANATIAAMAGNLAWTIPLFAWGVISLSGFAVTQMASSLGSAIQSAGAAAASAASTGNLSLGNTSMYNSSMWQMNASPSLRSGTGSYVDPGTGATYTQTAGGESFVGIQQSQLPVQANLTNSLKSHVSQQAESSITAAQTRASAWSSTLASSYSQMSEFASNVSSTTGLSNEATQGETASAQQSFSEIQKASREFGDRTGLTEGQAATLLAAAGASGSGGFSLLGNSLKVDAQARMNMTGNARFDSLWQQAKSFAHDSNFAENWQSAVDHGQRASASIAQSTNDTLAQRTSGGLQESQQARSDLQSSLQTAERYQDARSRIEESGAQVGANAAMAFRDYMQSQINPMTGRAFTPAQADQIMTQSQGAGGHAAAAAGIISSMMPGFLATNGESLAGVANPPTGTEVLTANEQFADATTTASLGVRNEAGGATLRAERASDLPGSDEVRSEAGGRMAASTTAVSLFGDEVALGRAAVEEKGKIQRGSVSQATDRENQSLSGSAIAAAGTSISQDIRESGTYVKDLADQFIDDLLE